MITGNNSVRLKLVWEFQTQTRLKTLKLRPKLEYHYSQHHLSLIVCKILKTQAFE